MHIRRVFSPLGITLWSLIVIGILGFTIGCGPIAGFHVSGIDMTPPDWVPPADYTFKVVVTMKFNRAVDIQTFNTPTTIKIDLEGSDDGRIMPDIVGTFRASSDGKTIVFISDQTLADLIRPQAGEDIIYTITVIGSGETKVTDVNGEALDGNLDGKPGGDYRKIIKIIG